MKMDMERLAEIASTPWGQFIIVGIAMLLLSRGYPAVVARWPGLAPYLGLLGSLLPEMAPRSGEALWELYRSAMGGKAANGKPLPAWRGPRQCTGCDGRALGADALPCRECAGLGVRHG
jgi:hypothetical protein